MALTTVGCAGLDEPRDEIESASTMPVEVRVLASGAFSPAVLNIREGQEVHFTGPDGTPLERTDALVRVSRTDLDAAAAAGEACMTSTRSYNMAHAVPFDDNELTGPLRRGPSGIYALGPEDGTGFFEADENRSCPDVGAEHGVIADAAEEETWESTEVDGADTKLCRLLGKNGKPAKGRNPTLLLESTWDNPDITGAVIRINWRDLYRETRSGGVTTIVPDYTRIDTELEAAARRGKLVFIELLAGDGIPAWIFNDDARTIDASATPLAPKSVIPIQTKDWGSDDDSQGDSCGYKKTMGSPSDAAYKTALLATIDDLAAHIRGNAIHFQALASFKVTGLNFLTGEMRLPNRCLKGAGNERCWCNTQIWATPLGQTVPSDAHDNATPLKGGGYTFAATQNFIRSVENTIYRAFGRRKTMHYMLIQDGFPKVFNASKYDNGIANDSIEYVNGAGQAIAFDQQVVDALDSGQRAEFSSVNSNGSPATGTDGAASALFAVQHAGLGPMPASCNPFLPQTLVDGKARGVLREPGSVTTSFGDYSGPGSGCPNKWAVREGYEGQIIGFQTTNSIDDSDQLASALWNATLSSNAVFVEIYEDTLWRAEMERRQGNSVLSTTAAGSSATSVYQKSLAEFTDELHDRRRAIAGFAANAGNRHMKDPFPDVYEFSFDKNLAAGARETYYYVNPPARCASGTLNYGTIEITGN